MPTGAASKDYGSLSGLAQTINSDILPTLPDSYKGQSELWSAQISKHSNV